MTDTKLTVAAAIALLTVSITFGGGGSPSPAAELFVQVVACLALGLVAWRTSGLFAVRRDPLPWLLVAAIVAIPLAQLIPLPPSLWASLPEREGALAAAALVGHADAWRPWSLYPDATLAALLSLIAPIVLVALVARLRSAERVGLIAWLTALALVSAVVGFIQFTSGGANLLRFYGYTHYGYATGFFANRNAAADLFLIGLIGCAALVATRERNARAVVPAALGAAAVLVGAVVATGSRTGMLLLIVPAIAVLDLVRLPALGRHPAIKVAAVGAAAAGIALVALPHTALAPALDRFALSGGRDVIWATTGEAIAAYWPWGSGFGTFVPVYAGFEQLSGVGSTYVNRAHNDWLEAVLEGGVVAVVVLAALVAFIAVRVVTMRGVATVPVKFAAYSLATIALHSIVDYPLRTLALAGVAALSFGLLTTAPAAAGEAR